jgi:hypothetical protein
VRVDQRMELKTSSRGNSLGSVLFFGSDQGLVRQESIDEELFDVISGYEALTDVRQLT